ncbi:MAG TPA: hypothetical protein VK966_07585 [Longimicrobiales bacterium]|nr:hypothetical protein [Longimicrobiales bacterium]
MRALITTVILFSGAWSQAAALDCAMVAVHEAPVEQGFTPAGHHSADQGHDHASHPPPDGHTEQDDPSSHHPASGCGVMMTCAPAALAAAPAVSFSPVTTAAVAQTPPTAVADAFPGFDPPPPRASVRVS